MLDIIAFENMVAEKIYEKFPNSLCFSSFISEMNAHNVVLTFYYKGMKYEPRYMIYAKFPDLFNSGIEEAAEYIASDFLERIEREFNIPTNWR